ncbi:flagellar basal-body MS-ring/collar protein FliF [Falsirhodobacter algicola]|uniref:Flagellar M-ring protein n=1 Tax=Falsirhodobacter algicola TaxID=2692330 RepID=A0A8J8MSZ6_9RHOB|nr:flagellar basal-body MS-ring/collar protein FliF [Falsirhodobacter algicola]QUS35917.1 flagellar M-ring protein FliF [Falsirhodobacter algicola]
MQNVLAQWRALTLGRRIIVGGATVAMFLAIIGLSRLAAQPDMALLYSGLDASAAGEVVAALEQAGAVYDVQGNAIRVDATQRDRLRLMLATQGLPATGIAGYEILDGLSGFGTTSQMFDAAYLRAKEGELARTILAMPGLRAARVHLAAPQAQPFRRDVRPTASVTVTMGQGVLTQTQADALKHLVAGAVPGLQTADVAVIDAVAGLIEPAAAAPSADRAETLRRNVERLLEARVGPGRAVVEVSVDVETEREQITERRFDPQGRVAISSETSERSSRDSGASGAVTVASNLPEGDAGADPRQSQNDETRETVNYEVSETQRDVLRVPGAIRKLGIAVLVDGVQVPDAQGVPQWQPRPEEELTALRDLVASAVGLDTARGDVLTLRSLQFEAAAPQGTLAEGAAGWRQAIRPMQALQLGVLALVALVLGLFVLRPILTARREALPPPAPLLALPGTVPPDAELVEAPAEEEPVARLRRLIEARQVESVEVLRGWMTEEERA